MDGSEPPSQNGVDKKIGYRAEGDDVERGSTPADDSQSGPRDPNLVDWDGPDDPMNPLNWPFRKKFVATATISVITLLTYVVHPMDDFRIDH